VRFATVGAIFLALEAGSAAAESTTSAAPPPGSYLNPVIAEDCPDPGVTATGDEGSAFVLACTGGTLRLLSSSDLVDWHTTGESILPAGKPPWAMDGSRDWAPEVHRVGDGWVAYFTAANDAGVLSIGAATGASPAGPWTASAQPLVQDPAGVIDATFFQDDDASRWLVYKVDANAQGLPTKLVARRLTDDGLALAGPAVDLLASDATSWEGLVVEAPWLVKRDGVYYLFYSGNAYDHRYRTGVARAPSLLGPYEKKGSPILGNNDRWVGPGHGSVVSLGASDYYVYHAWTNAGDGTAAKSLGRNVLVDAIQWRDGWPSIAGDSPSTTPQPAPG
jgi:arabinan endo-1,5-alpha-L-arabinosidase